MSSQQILLDDHGAAAALSLTIDDLDWLVQTAQLIPLWMRGKRRFLHSDLERLIATYVAVQLRGQHGKRKPTQ